MYKFYEDCEGHHVRTIDDEYVFCAETSEKAEEIVAALEKQISKKPRISIITKYTVLINYYRCPICDARVGDNDNPNRDISGYDYCPSCGQKIDWSE